MDELKEMLDKHEKILKDSNWIQAIIILSLFGKNMTIKELDEIQNKINLINLGHDFGSPMIDLKNPTYIYQMPEK